MAVWTIWIVACADTAAMLNQHHTAITFSDVIASLGATSKLELAREGDIVAIDQHHSWPVVVHLKGECEVVERRVAQIAPKQPIAWSYAMHPA